MTCYEVLWKKGDEGLYTAPLRNAREFPGKSLSSMNQNCFYRIAKLMLILKCLVSQLIYAVPNVMDRSESSWTEDNYYVVFYSVERKYTTY